MNRTVAEAPGLRGWLREGLRAAFLRPPRIGSARVQPRELLLLLALSILVELVLGRFEVEGGAAFNLRAWLAPFWSMAAMLAVLWLLLAGPGEGALPRSGAATWFALWLVAALPPGIVAQGLGIAHAHGLLPAALDGSALFAWASYLLLWGWTLGIVVVLGRAFGLRRQRLAALLASLFVVFALTAWLFPERPWEATDEAVAEDEAPGLVLTQENFETQQALFERALESLAPQRPDAIDVYGIVFAPYATEDVFLNESTMVADLLAQRFDARGRVLQFVNHVDTLESLPWATPLNLKRAIEAVARRMDREHDLLVVYLTSHAAQDFQLAASHPPLTVDAISPGELRVALDEAGIRNRVIAISACYSGSWVGPLASDTTLVMTAADGEHTSYGCGRLSELTYFGRAVFDEQLRRTHSFEQAFAAAVPVIRQREQEARKPDGFSNPQISVGAGLRPVLQALQAQLDAVPPAARP